jgi:Family of unknown function (DUF6519)
VDGFLCQLEVNKNLTTDQIKNLIAKTDKVPNFELNKLSRIQTYIIQNDYPHFHENSIELDNNKIYLVYLDVW